MKQRFIKLFGELNARNIEQEYALLCAYYSQEHRAYHNMNHVKNVLLEFDSVKHLASNPLALELAIWYHDVENYPWCHTNEERSVQVLLGLKDRTGISQHVLDYSANLIIVTKHTQEPKSIDEQIILDCDISSFGKSGSEFDLSNSNIRKEYSFVELSLYTQGRDKILRKFLDKQRIYYTDKLHDAYEMTARNNICRTIENLKKIEG